MPIQKPRGFTLIEIMIAVSIIAITFGVIITSAGAARKNARDAQRQSDLRTVQAALQQFYADQNYFPDAMTLNAVGSLTQCTTTYTGCSTSKKYLDPTPVDPTNTTPYLYRSGLDSTTNKAVVCSAGSNNRSCHYYILCGKLEGTSPQTAAQYADCTSNYPATLFNFQINP